MPGGSGPGRPSTPPRVLRIRDDGREQDRKGGAVQGRRKEYPLTLPMIFHRAVELFGDKRILTASPRGLEDTTYADWGERTRRLGGVLDDLGVTDDGRVGTFAWNTERHFALYFAVPC